MVKKFLKWTGFVVAAIDRDLRMTSFTPDEIAAVYQFLVSRN